MNDPSGPDEFKNKIDRSFQRFRLGLALFFVGFVILYTVDQLLEPSLLQEGLAALALVTLGSGLCLALVSEVRFVLYRIIAFFSSKGPLDK